MIVFLAAVVWREGFHHQPLPFFEYDVSQSLCMMEETFLALYPSPLQYADLNFVRLSFERIFFSRLPIYYGKPYEIESTCHSKTSAGKRDNTMRINLVA